MTNHLALSPGVIANRVAPGERGEGHARGDEGKEWGVRTGVGDVWRRGICSEWELPRSAHRMKWRRRSMRLGGGYSCTDGRVLKRETGIECACPGRSEQIERC